MKTKEKIKAIYGGVWLPERRELKPTGRITIKVGNEYKELSAKESGNYIKANLTK